jgi:hypothetical protein
MVPLPFGLEVRPCVLSEILGFAAVAISNLRYVRIHGDESSIMVVLVVILIKRRRFRVEVSLTFPFSFPLFPLINQKDPPNPRRRRPGGE